MPRCKTFLTIGAVALAVLVPLALGVHAHREQTSYPVVKLDIEPYDPRDLFYGHYEMFAFTWNWGGKPDAKACENGTCCLCLGEGDTNPKASLVSCDPAKMEKPAQCAHMLQGTYNKDNGQFSTGIERYYVDEDIALPLENLFRNKKETFAVGLAISPKGKPIVEQLYVAGKPVNEYVEEQGDALYQPVPEETSPMPSDRTSP